MQLISYELISQYAYLSVNDVDKIEINFFYVFIVAYRTIEKRYSNKVVFIFIYTITSDDVAFYRSILENFEIVIADSLENNMKRSSFVGSTSRSCDTPSVNRKCLQPGCSINGILDGMRSITGLMTRIASTNLSLLM